MVACWKYLLGAAALVVIAAPIAACAEEVTVALSFVEVQDQDAPATRVFRQARNLDLSVADRSRVSEWSARRLGRPNERVQDVKGTIGTPTRVGIASLLWRFDGADTVVREQVWPTFVETITIAFRPDGCNAIVAYHLKPGQAHFGMWNMASRQPMSISRIRAEDVRCKLGAAPVS